MTVDWYQLALWLICLYLLIQSVSLFAFAFSRDDQPVQVFREDRFPYVSVLVAARNEEGNIRRCLEALSRLQYPTDRIEYLIGDDGSEDATADVIQEFAVKDARFRLLSIRQNLGQARGKANVLAHLARAAGGDCYLITDADTAVGPLWARQMVGFFEHNTGIVSGTTLVSDTGWLGRMQSIDWNFLMGLLTGLNRIGLHSTAVGNNMAVLREAYESTGGYEHFRFSVTEDFQLYREVRKQGWKTKHVLTRATTNISTGVKTLAELGNQRKRWLTGALGLPVYWWGIFFVFGVFYYALAIIAWHYPLFALFLLLTKYAMDAVSLRTMQNKTGCEVKYLWLGVYELFSAVMILVSQILFALPFPVIWKKRRF